MPERQIGNPGGAYGQQATNPLDIVNAYQSAEAATGIVKYDLVEEFASTNVPTTAISQIKQMATATADNKVLGVAQEAIAAGKIGSVCERGVTLVKAGGGAISAGDSLIPSAATAGAVDAVTADATTVIGTVIGRALTDKAGGFVLARISRI